VTADVRAWLRRLDETHGVLLRGDDDMRRLVREHDAVPDLIAALTAVLDLADELEAEAQRQVDVYPPDSDALPAVVGRSWVNAARQFRAAVAAPLAGHDNEDGGGEGE
jgi:hypothetical protein